MALSQRLEFRQTQSLVMTPQLMQAIKLLQLSNLDLATYVEAELERNPVLDRADGESNAADELVLDPPADPAAGDWLREDMAPSRQALATGWPRRAESAARRASVGVIGTGTRHPVIPAAFWKTTGRPSIRRRSRRSRRGFIMRRAAPRYLRRARSISQ